MRRPWVVAALALVLLAPASAAADRPSYDIFGEQRVLVVPVTWGPEPFSLADMRRVVFSETDAYMRATSYGKAWLGGDVLSWQHALPTKPTCDVATIQRAGRAAAARAGFDRSRYDAVIFVHPELGCLWRGLTAGTEIFLNGEVSRKLVAHELGHTFGLFHANLASCVDGDCAATEYGDPWDVMGSGVGQYNSWEKALLGWLTNVTTVRATGLYAIDQLEIPSKAPQALVVQTGQLQYWIENRRDPARSEEGELLDAPGVLIRSGPPAEIVSGLTSLTSMNLLVPDPAARGRPELLPGDRGVIPGAFAVTFVRRSGTRAQLRFAWTDRTRPKAPRQLASMLADDGTATAISWDQAPDLGSGVDRYVVTVDGRRAAVATRESVDLSLSAGAHVVTIVAVDRAGNRSAPARARLLAR